MYSCQCLWAFIHLACFFLFGFLHSPCPFTLLQFMGLYLHSHLRVFPYSASSLNLVLYSLDFIGKVSWSIYPCLTIFCKSFWIRDSYITSPFWRRSALGFLWKEWCWNSSTLAASCEELTHWKRLWCWEGLGAGGEGDPRGWDGWMASLTRWTWVWLNSGSWW